MRRWRIALILIVLLAGVANAATNIAHAPHPPRCQIETVHPGNVLLPRWRQEVLGGGANSPPCNLLRVDKITFGHGVISSGHSTISRPRLALKRYEQRVHTMDQLMVSFQRWAGSADEELIFFRWAEKTIAGSYMRVTMGKLMVWALKSQPGYRTKWKPTSRAFDWCNNNVGVPL